MNTKMKTNMKSRGGSLPPASRPTLTLRGYRHPPLRGAYRPRNAPGWIPVQAAMWMCAALFLCVNLPLTAADGPSFSGLLDVKTGGGLANTDEALSGFDVYANLRLQERVKDTVTFYTAFNVQAASGMFAAFQAGGEAAAASIETVIEAERLYLRWAEDTWGLDAGLMPLHFGYGQVFAPSDFLIKKNPVVLDARPRGIVGAAFTQYPRDNIKVAEFAVFPPGALPGGWKDHHFGAAFESHFSAASVQALYAFQTASDSGQHDEGVHYLGGSIKLEAEIGILADTLYRYDPAGTFDHEGLALSAGADYTLGKLYVLAEYLYNGRNSASHRTAGGMFTARNFLAATFLYTISDLTNVTAQGLWSIDGHSLLPSFVFSHDLMQGFTLTVSAQVPLDLADTPGELGPDGMGQRFSLSAGVRLRI